LCTASRHVSCHALGLGGCGGAGDDIAFVLPRGFGEKGMCIRWFTNHSYWSISFDEAEELHNQFRFCKDPKLPFFARLGVPVDGSAGLCCFVWTSVCVMQQARRDLLRDPIATRVRVTGTLRKVKEGRDILGFGRLSFGDEEMC